MPGRVAPLDGIRAIAVIMVIVFHTTSLSGFPLSWLGPLATPVVHGWMGVDLFFAMSGFLITRLWIDEEASAPLEGAASRLRRFYARRSLRILPLYYFTLVAFIVLARWVPLPSIVPFARRVASHPGRLVPYLFFYTNYVDFGRDGAFAARWSLGVEEHFYLLWPCALLLARSRRTRIVVAASACAAILALRCFAIVYGDHKHGWASYMYVHYASHLRIDSILWGCLVALVYETAVREVRARRLALALATSALALLIVTGESTILRAPAPLGAGLGSSVLALAAALLCAEVTAAPRSILARALMLPPLPQVGFHSYAIYLIHPLAIDVAIDLVFRPVAVPTIWHWVLLNVVTVALAMGASMILHATLERPFRALRARFRVAPQST
jgi:peptidoglycan/LPS O-acetylase OafA/YrhL